MTCKDCIHYAACDSAVEMFGSHLSSRYADVCEQFEDTSLWVKLPCKVGDVLYTFSYGNIVSGEVLNIKYECEAENYGVFKRRKVYVSGEYTAMLDFYDIGKIAFLSKAEAEAALNKIKNKQE